MRIILYGLGTGRTYIEGCIKPSHEIVGYTDSYSHIEYFAGKRFYSLEQLKDVEFDYIVLTLGNRKTCNAIKQQLQAQFNIHSDKIVEFWKLYYATLNCNLIDYRVLKKNGDYDGLVLGLSHAEVGINTDYLDGNWCNLAISSQDLYGNKKVLEYAYQKYRDSFINLKYVIIDLFDWVYFNYDTSMASNALNYLGNVMNIDGISHHFKRNKLYEEKQRNIEKSYLLSTDKVLEETHKRQLAELFGDIHQNEYIFNSYQSKVSVNIIDKADDNYLKPDYMPAIAKRHFPETIKENIDIFKDILEFLYNINNQIKIYAVLLPRYNTIETIHKTLYQQWKKEFMEIIHNIKKSYNFEFISYKDYQPISGNNNFYADVSHLNLTGSIALTSLLNETLIKQN